MVGEIVQNKLGLQKPLADAWSNCMTAGQDLCGRYSRDWNEYVNVIGVISEPFAVNGRQWTVNTRVILWIGVLVAREARAWMPKNLRKQHVNREKWMVVTKDGTSEMHKRNLASYLACSPAVPLCSGVLESRHSCWISGVYPSKSNPHIPPLYPESPGDDLYILNWLPSGESSRKGWPPPPSAVEYLRCFCNSLAQGQAPWLWSGRIEKRSGRRYWYRSPHPGSRCQKVPPFFYLLAPFYLSHHFGSWVLRDSFTIRFSEDSSMGQTYLCVLCIVILLPSWVSPLRLRKRQVMSPTAHLPTGLPSTPLTTTAAAILFILFTMTGLSLVYLSVPTLLSSIHCRHLLR